MLVSFTVSNWKSFKEPVTLSMVASKEQNHSERVPHTNKFRTGILPVAAIYGGNASGKSNLFDALQFVQKLVVEGNLPEKSIPTEPFLLSDENRVRACSFKIEILKNEFIYDYSFEVSAKKIVSEKLVKINSRSEKILFTRKGDKILFPDRAKPKGRLDSVRHGTQENQLFLTNTITQKVTEYKDLYDWFDEDLILIKPTTRYNLTQLFNEKSKHLLSEITRCMIDLDTGISKIKTIAMPIESLQMPDYMKQDIISELKNNKSISVSDPLDNHYILTKKDTRLIAEKIIPLHKTPNSKEINFEFHQESDGTLRLLDLLPVILALKKPEFTGVVIIDELDRSLHSITTKKLLSLFFKSCSAESRKQLLFTTHDNSLIDPSLFRRDEMWLLERNTEGSSSLFSVAEFENRNNVDLRKAYLNGRLGGIQNISLDK